MIAAVVSAVSYYSAFLKKADTKHRFYGYPVVRVAFIYNVIQLILSFIIMACAEYLPIGPVVLVYLFLHGIALIFLISVTSAVDSIREQDILLKQNLNWMHSLQSKINQITAQFADPAMLTLIHTLSDQIRYSDPTSCSATEGIEQEINLVINDLLSAVMDNDSNAAIALSEHASYLLSERNKLCKQNKH